MGSAAFYYPVLKWKKGERVAISKINSTNSKILPIIEIVDEISPQDFVEQLIACSLGQAMIDMQYCDDEDMSDFCSYITVAASRGVDLIPVFYLQDFIEDANYYDSITLRFKGIKHYAIKTGLPSAFNASEIDLLFRLGTKLSDDHISGDLIINTGEVLDRNTANLTYIGLSSFISQNLSVFSLFDNVIISLTAFPIKLDIDKSEIVHIDRYDWQVFEKIYNTYSSQANHKIKYSDYGVTKFTDSDIDFSRMRYPVLPKVKYTTPTQYIIYKGERDHLRGVEIKSYINIAKEIVKSSFYYGEDFSYGDKEIYNKATDPKATKGNNCTWVTICANHHLAAVASQLSSLYGS